MEEILVKLGLSASHLVTGLIAGIVGLIFGKRSTETIRDKVKVFTVIVSGAVVTGCTTPLLFIWKPQWEVAEHSIAFMVGLLGMGIIEGFLNVVTKFKTKPVETIKEVKNILKKD